VTHGRTAALAVVVLGALAAGGWTQARWPEARPALDCPAGQVASVRLALGLRLPLNRAAEPDLARIPGVGAAAAHALVQARPFRSWDEVDSVRGVGPARLGALQQATELDP
jgi:competence protein ComEA